jgi:hypothetical protein
MAETRPRHHRKYKEKATEEKDELDDSGEEATAGGAAGGVDPDRDRFNWQLMEYNKKIQRAVEILENEDTLLKIIAQLETLSPISPPTSEDGEIAIIAKRFEIIRDIFDSTNRSIVIESIELFRWGIMMEEGHKLAESQNNRFIDDGSRGRIPIKTFWKEFFVDSGFWTQDAFDRTWEGVIRNGPKVYYIVRVLGEISLFLPLISDEMRWRTIANDFNVTTLRRIDLKAATSRYSWQKVFANLNAQIRQVLDDDGDFFSNVKNILRNYKL